MFYITKVENYVRKPKINFLLDVHAPNVDFSVKTFPIAEV